MNPSSPQFEVRLAQSEDELRAAQRLRYEVFIEELGGDGELVDHDGRLERDAFDPFYDHMLILDHAAGDQPDVVGVYRLMPGDRAAEAGGFYTADEYDLTNLIASGRNLLELGRSCVHRDYRGGPALFHLWKGLSRYTLERDIEVLFGVASFHGTDIETLSEPLAVLHHRHLAPPELRVRALDDHYLSLDLRPVEEIDRVAAMLKVPALIKAYLRLGGFIGDGGYVDHAFNTIDVCLVLDTERMSTRQRALYARDDLA